VAIVIVLQFLFKANINYDALSRHDKQQKFQITNQKSCLYQRGYIGRWVQDWDFANRTYYPNHGSYSNWHLADQNFTSTANQPFRLATSYRWIDDKCPIHEVNLEEFCNACLTLHISQILIMGDSLSIQFTQALQSLLGFPPIGRRATNFNARFSPWTMKCPPSTSYHSITFLMMRMSPITDWDALAKNIKEGKTGKADDFIRASKNKTAVVANIGAWMQTTAEYQRGFSSFIEWLRYRKEPDKVVVFWRPTIPGHVDCRPTGERGDEKSYDWKQPVLQEPYKDYAEYFHVIDSVNKTKDTSGIDTNRWELFESWNSWTYQQLYYSNNSVTKDLDAPVGRNSSIPTVYWLNIFNSSVLRRDGHIGFGDCLHYYLPGPPDWWAHFFHSALVDLTRANHSEREIH
jgi:hypothetical protein